MLAHRVAQLTSHNLSAHTKNSHESNAGRARSSCYDMHVSMISEMHISEVSALTFEASGMGHPV